MLVLISSDDKTYRTKCLHEVVSVYADGAEILTLDDSVITLADLEAYLYPSLFTPVAPLVHVKFILSEYELTATIAAKLAASPTVFVFEEFALTAPVVAVFKKHATVLHVGEKIKPPKKAGSDIFAVTAALTAPSKKDRWLAYQDALKHHAPEALLGILYWKLRDLIVKDRNAVQFRKTYHALLCAHASAWERGTPLVLAIEKCILST